MNYLKTILLSAVILFCGIISAQAQVPRGGIKGGVNLSNLYIDDVEDENVRVGFHAGVYTQLMITEWFGLQPELVFATKGAEADYDFLGIQGSSTFNLSYIDLPVLATFKLGDDADIHLGPYISYLIDVGTSTDGDFGATRTDLDRDDYEKWDYGLSGGIVLNFSTISVGVRYNYGLNEIAESEDGRNLIGDAKNSVAQAFVAFNLRTSE